MQYITNLIPRTTPRNRRPGKYMTPQYITIHETGNKNNSKAINERNYLINPNNPTSASFHIAVDSISAIECIPTGLKNIFPNTTACEVAYHAGDLKGNNTSIGIEICLGGDFNAAVKNTVKLTVKILKEKGWGIDRIKQHWHWSGKNCPTTLRANNNKLWNVFIEDIKKELGIQETNKVTVPPQTQKIGVITADVLNIRESIGTNSKIVGKYKKGDKVDILEYKTGWMRTPKGWVSGQYIKRIQ